jgi:hypothetical protein
MIKYHAVLRAVTEKGMKTGSMKDIMRILCCVCLCALPLCAQASGSGTKAFDFTRINFNARTIAMGGATVAMPNDAYGVGANPASIGFVTTTQAEAGYFKYNGDSWGGPLVYVRPYKNYGDFGGFVDYLSHGSLSESEAMDESGNLLGSSWHVFSLVGGLSWAKQFIPNFSTGVNVKGIYHAIEGSAGTSTAATNVSATGIAMDIGGQYRFPTKTQVILGGSVRNVGFMVSDYSQELDSLKPEMSASIGVSVVPEKLPELRIALDLEQANDDYLNYKAGAEYQVVPGFFLRAGYTLSQKDLENAFKSFSGSSSDTYVKSNANTFSLGAGFVTTYNGITTNIDAAFLQSLDPCFALTFLFSY